MKIIKENHKGQLTIGDLERMISALKAAYGARAKDIPVYIGDDDELNGVHCAWYANEIAPSLECNDDGTYYRELIEESSSNHSLGDDEVAILIS